MHFKHKNILIIGDHLKLLEDVYRVLQEKGLTALISVKVACSPKSELTSQLFKIVKINVSQEIDKLICDFDLILSVHCRQIFPIELLDKVKCINIHPGFNPYNRGWYPHVFSIINGLPAGATIHEMDEQIDHGPIIIQKEVPINSADTSETLYNKILEAEINCFSEVIEKILAGVYTVYEPEAEGNINYKADYEKLKAIDLETTYSAKEFIRILRALSHGSYINAFYLDEQNHKVFIKFSLEKEREP